MPSTPAPKEQSTGLSPVTLMIASAASVVAAIVVSRVWGPGTLIGAAVTPVIVTLVSEALRRPAEKITVVRVSPTGTEVRERSAPPAPGEMAPRSVHRARRRPLAIALATGLIAFVIGAAVLTSSELLFGSSAVGGGGGRTTVLGGAARTTPEPRTTTTSSGETTTEAPAPEPTTVTTTQTAPAAPPPPTGGATGATGATTP